MLGGQTKSIMVFFMLAYYKANRWFSSDVIVAMLVDEKQKICH